MKVELHLHTSRYSACAINTPEEMMQRLVDTGYEAVYITEHNMVWSDKELDELRAKFPPLKIFPGVELNCGLEGIQHLLVLSATAKDEDLRQTIRHFGTIKVQSLIFTKLDETLSPGSMFNQLLRFSHPLSYLGIGQCVPEDIRLASHKNLLAFLFPSGRTVKEE